MAYTDEDDNVQDSTGVQGNAFAFDPEKVAEAIRNWQANYTPGSAAWNTTEDFYKSQMHGQTPYHDYYGKHYRIIMPKDLKTSFEWLINTNGGDDLSYRHLMPLFGVSYNGISDREASRKQALANISAVFNQIGAKQQAYGGRLFAQGGRIKVKPAPNTIRSRNGLKMRRADDLGNADYDIYF